MELLEIGSIAAIATDVHLAGDMSASDLDELREGWWRYPVLIFPEQHFDDQRQIEFSRLLGDLEPGKDADFVMKFSTVGPDGNVLPPTADQARRLLPNMGWHTDSSHKAVGAAASLLAARLAAPVGGDTEWADMRAAYDHLDDSTKDELEHLIGVHEFVQPDTPYDSEDVRRRFPPVAHPLVRQHPVTGRKSLYLGFKLSYILGQDPVASRARVKELTAWACQAPRTFGHHLNTGDAVLWDNLAVAHRARPCPPNSARTVHRTTVIGDQSDYPPLPDVVPGFEAAMAMSA